MSGVGNRRLFLALWPDAGTRTRLAELAREWSPQPVAAENLHMTLHFLGASSRAQEQCYANVISRIDFEPIEINIDCMGMWGRVGIRWLGCSAPPAELAALVGRLGQALAGCGYQPERRPFIPHVTISRTLKNSKDIEAEFPAVCWLAKDLVLAESVADNGAVRYLVRARQACR